MKIFTIKILKVSIVLVAIVAFNYLVDPFLLLNPYKQGRLTNLLVNGKDIAFKAGYNQCLVKSNYLEAQKTPMDIMVLGSSRSNQIGQELFKGATFYNASLYGGRLKDMLGIWQLIEEADIRTETVILEVNPHILKFRHTRNRKWLTKASNSLLMQLNFEDLTEKDPFMERSKLKLQGLFSIQYGLRSIKKNQYEVWTKNDTISDRVLFSDGSERALQIPDIEKAFSTRYRHRLPGLIKNGEYQMQLEAAEVFTSFVEYLQSKGKKVVLFIPPLYPDIYKNDEIRRIHQSFQDYLEQLRNTFRLEVIGGLDPSAFHLNTNDFSDHIHFQKNTMRKVLNEKVESTMDESK